MSGSEMLAADFEVRLVGGVLVRKSDIHLLPWLWDHRQCPVFQSVLLQACKNKKLEP